MKLTLIVLLVNCLVAYGQTNESNSNVSNGFKEEIVTFPIQATGYTDPNYEKNLAKSKAYVPFEESNQEVVVIDLTYVANEISRLKSEIAEKEEVASTEPYVKEKIQQLADELHYWELKYKDLSTDNQ